MSLAAPEVKSQMVLPSARRRTKRKKLREVRGKMRPGRGPWGRQT